MYLEKQIIIVIVMDRIQEIELADHDHQWSNELRKKFERVVSFLNKL